MIDGVSRAENLDQVSNSAATAGIGGIDTDDHKNSLRGRHRNVAFRANRATPAVENAATKPS